MPTTGDFLIAAQWSGYLTVAIAAVMVLSFIFKWGFRFRLFGVTSFMVVLTVGLFSLSLVPLTRTQVPGAGKFATLYDGGANRAVITVAPTMTEEELVPTLQQAAVNLFSPGRLSNDGSDQLTIEVRTVLHPEPGVSQPLILGRIKRSLFVREDENMEIILYPDRIAQLPHATEVEAR